MIEVIDAERNAEYWRTILRGFPRELQDIYYQPEYVALHRMGPGTRALLFTYRRHGLSWVSPFLMRPIARIGSQRVEEGFFDIETAYGYGGPLANTEDPDFLAEAHAAFAQWCREQGVVTQFVRFHPVLESQRWAGPYLELVQDRVTFSIDFMAMRQGLAPYSARGRNSLSRARRLGLSTVHCSSNQDFERFRKLYFRTMDRLCADGFYYFETDYFAGLERLIGGAGFLLAVSSGPQWHAAGVFLKGNRGLHYHLSASNPEEYMPGAVNLMLDTAAQLGRKEGLAWLHLGGGRSSRPDDSLARFKRSMATHEHEFYIGKGIHRPEVYQRLCRVWKNHYPELADSYGKHLLCYRYTPQAS